MARARERLLIVDDDRDFRDTLAGALAQEFDVTAVGDEQGARSRMGERLSLVLLDIRLTDTDRREGLDLLREFGQQAAGIPVIMMTAYADLDTAVEALRRGAVDFVQKSKIEPRELLKTIRAALENAEIRRRYAFLKDDYRRIEPWELVGDSAAVNGVRDEVEKVAADGYVSVLVTGETGTGKELVARAVHARGWRRSEPFVAISLAAFPRELIDAELFGHTVGAFSGAKASRLGYFERASGGVLFLDEIGELSLDVQAKLLRVLETREVTRLGSTAGTAVDFQLVCATNIDLDVAVRQRQFRSDLLYRLKAFAIIVPPLRVRKEDIPLLVDHFLDTLRFQGRTRLAGISAEALSLLESYDYPGNVRELKSLIDAAAVRTARRGAGSLIESNDLVLHAPPITPAADFPVLSIPLQGLDLDRESARYQLSLVAAALDRSEGRKGEAWKLLGLNDRFALRRRIKQLAQAYPDLLSGVPVVAELYGEDT